MKNLNKTALFIAGFASLFLIAALVMDFTAVSKLAAVVTAITLAIGLGAVQRFKGFRYTAWILAAVVAGMLYPEAFTNWGSVNLRNKTWILIIIQLVMFGTGTQMHLSEFKGIASTGKGVLVGLICHFTIMPLVGFLLTRLFHFDPEIAAGIILIGCCSSGLASNVMVYLAKGNLVLSVLVTACSTLAAPLLTPLFMKLLAGTLVEVKFINMMLEIIKMVLVPIGAALLHDFLKNANTQKKKKVYLVGLFSLIWMGVIIVLLQNNSYSLPWEQSLTLSAFFAGAILVGIGYHFLYNRIPALDRWMPLVSMFGIIYFTLVTTAAGSENLKKVGILLFLVAVIHNAAGYFFGFWLSRIMGLNKDSSRTIAFEVGLQNGGMASGIAGSMGKLGTIGLAAAVFSPWMNISGSILANYWRRKKINEKATS
jgi:BASS family bile acid:Na+ symporter